MTDTAGPFDGAPWAEAQWARHAAAWAPSGVYGTPAASTTTGDLPLSVSGLSVGVGAGRAWVRGFGFERTGTAVMQAVTPNTHASFSRRDRIVLRRNLATHTVTPVLLTGTPSGSPVAPALTQSEAGSWDTPLFSFLVPPNSGTGITGLVDERQWVDAGGNGRPSLLTTVLWPNASVAGTNNIPTSVVTAYLKGAPYRLRAAASLETMLAGGGIAQLQLFIDGAMKDQFKIRGATTTNELFPAKVSRTVDITDGRAVPVFARLDIPFGLTGTTFVDDVHSWLTVEAVPL